MRAGGDGFWGRSLRTVTDAVEVIPRMMYYPAWVKYSTVLAIESAKVLQ